MKKDNNLLGVYSVIYLIFFSVSIAGCSKKPADDRMLGSWYLPYNSEYIILNLEKEGKWSSNIRVEDISKKIEKKKSDAKGEWRVEENRLTLDISEAEDESYWKQVKNPVYDIVKVAKNNFQLKDLEGKILEWKRVREGRKEGAEPDYVTKNLGPMAVNLFNKNGKRKERYLCIDIDMMLDSAVYEEVSSQIHPKIKEAVIFYLSSLTYRDVNRVDKLHIVQERLRNILSPYMEGALGAIVIKKIIVTSNTEKVENFLAGKLEDKEDEEEKPREEEKPKENH